MNVNSVFTAPARPEPKPRADAPVRSEEPESTAESRETTTRRAATRAEFSALMALLAGAGTKVRTDLLKQVPAEGASLLDSLLDAAPLANDGESLEASDFSALLRGSASSSQAASDALRYGLLKDTQSQTADNDLDMLQSALNDLKAGGTSGIGRTIRAEKADDHAHFNEVVGRILSRRGMSVDQLKARGDEHAAELRGALDALLARAGTPGAAELLASPDNAAMAAAAAALAKANAVSAADPTTPVKDVDALHPQLRSKLDRVIERMKNEYGNDVQVVETARSQDRQDWLYEQGRSRAGNVVTWTQRSAHTRGEAVDVIVDGSFTNAEGFARLQRIAKEEGLRTLGLRDPGHLELNPVDTLGERISTLPAVTVAASTKRDAEATPLISTGAAQSTAVQAGVARVAGVASVAGVARVGESGFDRRYTAKTDVASATTVTLPNTAPASLNGQGNAFGRGERDEQGRPMNDGRKLGQVRRETNAPTDAPAFGTNTTVQSTTLSATPNTVEASAPAAGARAAERAGDIQDLRESAPAGSLSRITLDIDGQNGGQDRITVDLRGSSVGTQINTDAVSAERLRMRTADLQDALGRHGLESDSVRISSTARTEASEATRIGATDRDGLRLASAQQSGAGDSSMQQGPRDRAATAREWDRPESRQARDDRESARDGNGQRGQRQASNGSDFGAAYGSAS